MAVKSIDEAVARALRTAARDIEVLAASHDMGIEGLVEGGVDPLIANALDAETDLRLATSAEAVQAPMGFPRRGSPFDQALRDPDTGRPLVVFELEWGFAADSQADALVLDLFKLAVFVRDGLMLRAYLVFCAPRPLLEQPKGSSPAGLSDGAHKLAELLAGDRTIRADELAELAPEWWSLRYPQRAEPKVPEQLELHALDSVAIAGGERGDWELRCVRVGVKRPVPSLEEKRESNARLLAAIKERLPDIEALLEAFRSTEEDGVYRYYHHSFKVFHFLQPLIERARTLFDEVAPAGVPLAARFAAICEDALDHDFEMHRTNANWESEARPILEAFWHCKYFLEQMKTWGHELEHAPEVLPAGWAAVLYLYRQR